MGEELKGLIDFVFTTQTAIKDLRAENRRLAEHISAIDESVEGVINNLAANDIQLSKRISVLENTTEEEPELPRMTPHKFAGPRDQPECDKCGEDWFSGVHNVLEDSAPINFPNPNHYVQQLIEERDKAIKRANAAVKDVAVAIKRAEVAEAKVARVEALTATVPAHEIGGFHLRLRKALAGDGE
jgi:hypothetical protein